MRNDRFTLLLLGLAVGLWTALANAQYTRDKAANEKIREAIDKHFVAAEFDQAEGLLVGTILACELKCKPSTLAKAWMYIGIVRGSSRDNDAGVRDAFQRAVSLDPNVELDAPFATPETIKIFEEVGGKAVVQEEPVEPSQPGAEAPAEETGAESAGLTCTPGASNVQTRRPIPIACQGDSEATSMSLRYQAYGTKTWTTVVLKKQAEFFQAEIPCTATEVAGPFKYFVASTDASGDVLDSFGTKKDPIVINVAPEVSEAPPSFPGQPPPERCKAVEICPPDFPGCDDGSGPKRGNKDWGQSCDNSSECLPGLLCRDGTCETAPTCSSDAECEVGVCKNGRCDIGAVGPAESYPKNFVGLHFAADFGVMGGTDVCRTSNPDFSCHYSDGAPYPPPLPEDVALTPGEPGEAYHGGGIESGFAGGTLRILLSYDRALAPTFTIGTRLGFAFRGSPARENAPDFLPFHGEARVAYWFLGLNGPLRPSLHLRGGVARIDLQTTAKVKDCSGESPRSAFEACIEEEGDYDSANQPDLPEEELTAYKKLGQAFIGGGAGVVFGVGPAGIELDLSALYTFPDSGLVLEPSLGGMLAF